MVDASHADVATAGRRLKTRIYLALALSSVVPLVMLAVVAHVYVLPLMNPMDATRLFSLLGLLLLALLAALTGSYVIWDLGRVLERLATLLAEQRGIGELAERGDDVGTIMSSFSRMLETV